MAKSDIIKHTDLIEEGAIRDHFYKELQDVIALFPALEAGFVKSAKNISAAAKSISFGDKSSLEEMKKVNAIIEQSSQLYVAHSKVQKTKIQLTEKEIAQAQIDRKDKKDRIDLLKAEIVELNKTVGTLQRLEAANTRLRLERLHLDAATASGAKRLKEINTELDRNNKYIIENSDKLKQQKLNVGNYTESIKKAFEGTGVLGDAINRYLGIITLLTEKIEGVVSWITKENVAKETATVVADANTVAEEKNAAALEAEALASKTTTASLETQTVATEATTVATNTLGNSIKKLVTNPYVIAAVAIAALAKVIYDNVTATQEQKDAWDAGEEAAKAYAKAILIAGVDAKQLAKDVNELTLEEFKRQDLAISALTEKAKLRAEAAEARSAAMEEGKTVKERIVLLKEFVDKTREANQDERVELEKDVEIKRGIVEAYGKIVTREQRRQLQEAIAALSANKKQTADETRKANKQAVNLLEKYNDDTKKMLQEAEREEIEQIDAFSKYKAEQLTKQLAKDLKLNKLSTEQKVANLKDEQKKLGEISPAYTDEEGVFHKEVDNRKNFQREILALQNEGAGKAKELTSKTNAEIEKLNEDFRIKQLDAQRKYQDDIDKLNESYLKTTSGIDKQKQDNEIQTNQFEIDHLQNEISDLKDKRDEEILRGKDVRHLTLKDLQQFFDNIDTLEKENYLRRKQRLTDDADFTKYNERNTADDQVQSIKDKYAKIKIEDEKAIRDKNKNQKDANAEVTIHNSELDKKEAEEIIDTERNLAAQIEAIDAKLKGDLSNAEETELKRERTILKQKKEITKQEIEDQKKLVAERIKITNEITDGLQEGLRRRSEIQQQADQRDIDFHQRNLDVQSKLAAAGQDNILAEELAAADKAEEKKIQDAKKAARQEENIALAKVFADTLQQALDKDEPFLKAFGQAIGATGITKEVFARLFSGFYEGTEDTGTAKNPLDNKGGRLIIAHDNERIVPKKLNEKLDGMSNIDMVNSALAFQNIYKPQFDSANVTTTKTESVIYDVRMTNILAKRIDRLTEVVESKPVQNIRLGNKLGEWTEEIEEKGRKTIINYMKQNKRPSLRRNG